MRIACNICSDLYDQFSVIVSINCGHVYHEACLHKWLVQSCTCPECRMPVKLKDIRKLFVTVAMDETLPAAHLENRVSTLQAELNQKNVELGKVRSEKEEIRKYVRVAEEESQKAVQEFHAIKTKAASLTSTVKDLRKQLTKLNDLENENLSLKKRIDGYHDIYTIIKGTQKDVDDALGNVSNTPEALKSVVTSCSLLKRELQNTIDSKTELRSELASQRRMSASMKSTLSKANEEINRLKEHVKSLEVENIALIEKKSLAVEQIGGRSAKATITYESPMPLERKDSYYSDIELTPLSQRFNYNKSIVKRKVGNARVEIMTGLSAVPTKKVKSFDDDVQVIFAASSSSHDENSLIRNGYNGFGGHSKFIGRSVIKSSIKPLNKRPLNK